MRKRLVAGVFAVAVLSSGLGGCFDGLSDSLENLAGIPGTAIRNELDEAAAAAEANEMASIDAWIQQKEQQALGLPAGASCVANNECASGTCAGSPGTCS